MGDAEAKKAAEEELAKAKAKIDELTEKVKKLTEDLEKQVGIAENAEKKFKEMGEETGDNRKAVAEAAKELIALRASEKKAADDLAEANKLLVEATKQGPKLDDGNNRKPTKEQVAEIESTLTEDDLKLLDKARESATEEERKKIDAGGDEYLALLKGLKEAKAEKDSDLPPWRKKPAQEPKSSDEGMAKRMKELFNTAKKGAGYTPPAPNTGTSRETPPGRPQRQGKSAPWLG